MCVFVCTSIFTSTHTPCRFVRGADRHRANMVLVLGCSLPRVREKSLILYKCIISKASLSWSSLHKLLMQHVYSPHSSRGRLRSGCVTSWLSSRLLFLQYKDSGAAVIELSATHLLLWWIIQSLFISKYSQILLSPSCQEKDDACVSNWCFTHWSLCTS